MTTYTDPRHTPAYKRARKLFLDAERAKHGRFAPCALCPLPVDMDLPGNVDAGPSVDHIQPVKFAPHLVFHSSNMRLTHLLCNKRRGTGDYVTDGQRGQRRARPAPAAADDSHPFYPFRESVEHHDACFCDPTLPVSRCY